jgi:hypothetical protein
MPLVACRPGHHLVQYEAAWRQLSKTKNHREGLSSCGEDVTGSGEAKRVTAKLEMVTVTCRKTWAPRECPADELRELIAGVAAGP